MDPDTGLPALLSRRQVERIAVDGINEQSLKDMLGASVQLRRGDKPAAEASLLTAVEREPRLIAASLQLASLYEEREHYDGAIAEYRRIISVSPRNTIALNNLAYALAVRKQQAAEALPLALLAYQQSQNPTIADTVAWIHHLLGDNRSALPLIERAAAGSPNIAEIQLHAAFIHAELSQVTKARTALDAAVKLDPELAKRPDVVALRQRVGGG
jgi:Tfp pilus assembly protein PilF